MPSLFVTQGRDQGHRFELAAACITLGREAGNQIQFHDTEVSRRHAEIRQVPDGFELVDLESSNGTYVNDRRIDRQLLRTGDRIALGRTLLIFTASDYAAADYSWDDGIDGSVDIVPGIGGLAEESRIVYSVPEDEGSSYLAADVPLGGNAWLSRARSNLQIMYRTALAVSHTLDIDQLLSRIMELIFEWVEADRGCIMLVDRETDDWMPRVRRDRQQRSDDDMMSISRTILDYVREKKEGVLTSDAREDTRFDEAGSIVRLGVREAICVPMQGRYGIVGAIYIDTYTPPARVLQGTSNRFRQEHLKLMVAIAHQAALAIEDTSYYSALVQAERLAAIGQTIANLSHHIKNILQGIRGGSYLIEEGLKDADPSIIRRGWSIVEKNQERISQMVLDMLSYSKERQPDRVPSDLNRVVREVLELIRPRVAAAEITLHENLQVDLPTMVFDPEGLHRAILNVISNAIDACENRPQPAIHVTTRFGRDANQLEIEVQDNGAGIAADDLGKVFMLFVSTKGNRGTGLGLPVSQKILREHGGDIRVESTLSVGSTFTMCLPAVSADAAHSDIRADLIGIDEASDQTPAPHLHRHGLAIFRQPPS